NERFQRRSPSCAKRSCAEIRIGRDALALKATAEISGRSRRSWTRAAKWLAGFPPSSSYVNRTSDFPTPTLAFEPALASVRQSALETGDAAAGGDSGESGVGCDPNQKIGLLS